MRDLSTILSVIEGMNLLPKDRKSVLAIIMELQRDRERVRLHDRERQRKFRAGGRRKKLNGSALTPDQETQLFARGKQVLGENAGGLITRLIKARGTVAKARSAIEAASEKQDPREYVSAIIRGASPSSIDPRLG
jgi:hypothetical protein